MYNVPECEYGEKCQVDYGEKWMHTPQGRTVKVYFIVFCNMQHTIPPFFAKLIPQQWYPQATWLPTRQSPGSLMPALTACRPYQVASSHQSVCSIIEVQRDVFSRVLGWMTALFGMPMCMIPHYGLPEYGPTFRRKGPPW